MATLDRMAKFIIEVHCAKKSEEVLTLEADRILIGRDEGDIVLHDPQCSNPHAELVVSGDALTLNDLESTNGTFLEDGTRLFLPTPISAGAVLRMGACTLVLRAFEAKELVPEVPDLEVPVPRAPVLPPLPALIKRIELATEGPDDPDWHSQAPPPVSAKPSGPLPAPSLPPSSSRRPALDVPPPNMPAPSLGAIRDIPRPNFGDTAPPPMSMPVPPLQSGTAFAAPVPKRPSLVKEVVVFTRDVVRDFQRHAPQLVRALAVWVVPGQLFAGLLSLVPIVGSALQSAMTVLVVVAFVVFGTGVASEGARRVTLGEAVSDAEVVAFHAKRWLPWFLRLLVPLGIAWGGFFAFVLPGVALGGMLLPLSVAEEHEELDFTRRHWQLVRAQPVWALVPMLLVAAPLLTLATLVTALLGRVPVVGGVLSSLALGGAMSAGGALAAYVSFQVYLRVLRAEGVAEPEQALRQEAQVGALEAPPGADSPGG